MIEVRGGLIISQSNLSGSQTVSIISISGISAEIAPLTAFAAEKLTIRHNRNGSKTYFAFYFEAYTTDTPIRLNRGLKGLLCL